MSQTTHPDLEGGNDPDGHRDNLRSTPSQPLQGEYNFGDSSGPHFSIYSKAAEEEDNKMVERWQKDADGILIFTGLFSAAVAALLAVTVQDLRPNSQDTSAFYLGNIYEVLADPNVTRASAPSPAKPPPFSAPRYAVWVNSLWFLSLVMSVSCALWATSLHQWARRYIRLTQPARCSPEKRARMHAFFEGLPTLLHLSLFLFFGGLVIFLFNVDQEVFLCVVWWIGLFTLVYGLITLLPLIRHNSPYYGPLSLLAWFLYSSIEYVTFTVLSFIAYRYGSHQTWVRCDDLRGVYRGWMLGGVEKAAEEVASERSSEIDGRILGWTISALGDDDSLQKFFEAIPGFFNSKLVIGLERDLHLTHLKTFWGTLNWFMGRTLTSNSVTKSVKSRRDIICRDIMGMIPCLSSYIYGSHFDQAPVSIERLQAMARWFTHLSHEVPAIARIRVARNLLRIQEHDNRWIALASDAYGLAARDIEHYVALGGDNALLAILIHVSRQAIHSYQEGMLGLVRALTQFDIRHTIPGLQHDFCALWDELAQEARNSGSYSTPVEILCLIRRLYITLHQGTDAVPTAFYALTDSLHPILLEPSSYPLCDIVSHRPDSIVPVIPTQPAHSPDASSHHFTSGAVSQQVQEASNIARLSSPPDLTTPSEIRDISQVPAVTSPALTIHTSPCPTEITLAATDVNEIFSHVPTLAPVPSSDTFILNNSLTSCDTGACSTSNLLLPVSSVVSFSIPASPPSFRDPSPPNTELRALPSSTTPSHPTGNITSPRLRVRGLVNSGNMCIANAVLYLIVHLPPFWDRFMELIDLKRQREAESLETGGTPLVDATVRFFDEFMFKDKEPPEQAAGGRPREDEEAKKEHNAVNSLEPAYMYEAMKEKRQLNKLLDGRNEDAEEFLGHYLDALDEELADLHAHIGTHKLASAPSVKELEEESPEDHTEVGMRDCAASSVESPISRIFGGRSRSTLRVPNKPDTITTEAWRSLKLYIQPDSVHTIQDALAHFSQPQPVQAGQSNPGEANQQVLLEALPPVLVLHLERFLYDAATDGINKVSKPIQFTPELEIPSKIMAPIAGKSADAVHYKLSGVLYNNGETSSSGHYTVDVLHPKGDGGSEEVWLNIDDEAVRAVRHEVVFGGHDSGQVDRRCAYMLFYCRAPTQT